MPATLPNFVKNKFKVLVQQKSFPIRSTNNQIMRILIKIREISD